MTPHLSEIDPQNGRNGTTPVQQMREQKRLEWKEVRQEELFFIVAENQRGLWKFYERSTWEVRWFEVPPTREWLSTVKHLEN